MQITRCKEKKGSGNKIKDLTKPVKFFECCIKSGFYSDGIVKLLERIKQLGDLDFYFEVIAWTVVVFLIFISGCTAWHAYFSSLTRD